MAALRWLTIVLAAAFAVASFDVAAQSQTPTQPQSQAPVQAPAQAPAQTPAQTQRSTFSNPAEYDNYMAALNTKDPARKAQAMEVRAVRPVLAKFASGHPALPVPDALVLWFEGAPQATIAAEFNTVFAPAPNANQPRAPPADQA